jgi:hypothetical protein
MWSAGVKRQLRHLAEVGKGSQRNVTLQVLPIQALIRDFTLPRCSFSIYAYPDPGDPRVVAIDTVTSEPALVGHQLLRGGQLKAAWRLLV